MWCWISPAHRSLLGPKYLFESTKKINFEQGKLAVFCQKDITWKSVCIVLLKLSNRSSHWSQNIFKNVDQQHDFKFFAVCFCIFKFSNRISKLKYDRTDADLALFLLCRNVVLKAVTTPKRIKKSSRCDLGPMNFAAERGVLLYIPCACEREPYFGHWTG